MGSDNIPHGQANMWYATLVLTPLQAVVAAPPLQEAPMQEAACGEKARCACSAGTLGCKCVLCLAQHAGGRASLSTSPRHDTAAKQRKPPAVAEQSFLSGGQATFALVAANQTGAEGSNLADSPLQDRSMHTALGGTL